MWNPSTCKCECNRACKIDWYLEIRIFSRDKHLFGKLVLTLEDEILSRTETPLSDKKEACKNMIVLFTLFHW